MSEQQGHPPPASRGLQLNGPTVISVLYIATYFTVITALVGIILAYVWKQQAAAQDDWDGSHYAYLIRTFWMGVGGYAVVAALGVVVLALFTEPRSDDPAGVGIALAVAAGLTFIGLTVILIVRCVMSMIKAQQCEPMPRPRSWTI